METSRILAEKGAFVYIVALNDSVGFKIKAEFKSKGLKVKYLHMDVLNKDEVCNVVEEIVKENKRIDILVHCAGLSKKYQ